MCFTHREKLCNGTGRRVGVVLVKTISTSLINDLIKYQLEMTAVLGLRAGQHSIVSPYLCFSGPTGFSIFFPRLQRTSHSVIMRISICQKCNKNSVCSLAGQCSHLAPFSVTRPALCGFSIFGEPIVCCPPRSINLSSSVTTEKRIDEICAALTKKVCPFVPFVSGGTKAKAKTHRHMAHIGYGDVLDNADWNCGGSIISEMYILTAAHCVKNSVPPKWVRVGDLDTSTDTDDSKPEIYEVSKTYAHPNYKPPALYNDIALLKLTKPIIFNEWTSPICLYSKPVRNEKTIVAGWGRVDIVGETSSHLLEAQVSLVDGNKCRSLISKSARIPNGIDTNTMICAGEKDGSKDSCSGDSGGPLILNLTAQNLCIEKQIGIVSFGQLCGAPNKPGVYTKVLSFIPWIESIVWP